MEFSRQEYWSGLPFPFPEDLPNPGIEPGSPALQTDSLMSEPPGKPMDVCVLSHIHRHAATQFCHGNVSSHTQHTNEHIWMCREELYLQKQATGWIWPMTLVYQPLPYINR